MDTVQFVMLIVVAAITGMASVLDEAQFHRPLIACTLVGLVLGDITTGIILGGTLELMALGWMNVGAAMAPDAALASVVATILVIVGHQDIAAGIALAVPLAAAGQVLTIFVRTITVFFQHLADKFAEDGNMFGIEMCHVAGLMLQAIRVAVPAALVALIAGTDTVSAMLSSIPEVVTRGLQVAGGFIVVSGGNILNPDVTNKVVKLFSQMAQGAYMAQADLQGVSELSHTERSIAQIVGRGLSNKEISAALALSEGTVRNSLSTALSKLDLRDRTQLALWTVQIGLSQMKGGGTK